MLSGGLRQRALLLEDGELDGERADDALHDSVLDLEHLLALAVITLRPELRSPGRVGELDADARAPLGLPNAALHEVAHTQVAADLLRGRAALLVWLHGVRRRDTHFREAPEGVDDILCDAVAEVVALRVAALVGERQHGDRGSGPHRRPTRPAWLRRRPPYQYRDGDADDRGHHAHAQRLLPLGSRRPSRRRLFARRGRLE